MDFNKVIKKRHSIRQFRPIEVPDKLVKEWIETAKLAPSAGNLQSYQVAVTKQKLTPIDSPLNLVICADPDRSASRYGERGRSLYSIQDATIFGAYLQLAIVNSGSASVWIGAFDENKIKKILNLPKNLKPVTIIAVGYPAGEKTERKRRSFEEILVTPV